MLGGGVTWHPLTAGTQGHPHDWPQGAGSKKLGGGATDRACSVGVAAAAPSPASKVKQGVHNSVTRRSFWVLEVADPIY